MHLVVPFTCVASGACRDALNDLALPHLDRLLQRLAPAAVDRGDPASLTPPHERVLAKALGLSAPDGCVPWAAHEAAGAGLDEAGGINAGMDADPDAQGTLGAPSDAWAWITPCHWQVHGADLMMANPRALALRPDESQALLAAMRPFFEEDGIALRYAAPDRWLARGEPLRDLRAASLDRVVGREIGRWLPAAPEAAPLRRLQNEMQMLLYTHPVNDERSALALAPVNSFWVSGAGALPALWQPPQHDAPRVIDALKDAALEDDAAAWADAWRALDAGELAAAERALHGGEPVQITLCGEADAWTFGPAQIGLTRQIMKRIGHKPISSLGFML
ncbi:MAG: Regulatory protein, RpfE type [Burkholderiaceae bacterium]|jgi:hypothetical protein|nr:MAG: Regulatory protein, RpfE type [Burkholderiaceae bacterium]